jgi:hypothetical protein
MTDEQTGAPDGTAVRVALWRAMHVQVDPPPHVLEDEIGLRLTAPDDGRPSFSTTPIAPDSRCPRQVREQPARRSSASTPRRK